MAYLLLATRSHAKRRIFGPTFERHGFQVLTLRQAGLDGAWPPETGSTPLENALAKARRCHSAAHPWVFGDDSSLQVDALGGEPGLEVRRWGGLFADDVDDETWLAYLLSRLEAVPPERRTAVSVAGWALIAPDGSEHTHIVRYPFCIGTAPIRPMSPGSPLSAVMVGPVDGAGLRPGMIDQEFERWGILPALLTRYQQ